MFKSPSLCFVLFVFFVLSCKSKQNSNSYPEAIKKEIVTFSTNNSCNDAKVNEMKFQNQVVYLFDVGSCVRDKESNVYDKNGQLLGSLGGFAGNTSINGEDFSSAQFIRLIWEMQ